MLSSLFLLLINLFSSDLELSHLFPITLIWAITIGIIYWLFIILFICIHFDSLSSAIRISENKIELTEPYYVCFPQFYYFCCFAGKFDFLSYLNFSQYYFKFLLIALCFFLFLFNWFFKLLASLSFLFSKIFVFTLSMSLIKSLNSITKLLDKEFVLTNKHQYVER